LDGNGSMTAGVGTSQLLQETDKAGLADDEHAELSHS